MNATSRIDAQPALVVIAIAMIVAFVVPARAQTPTLTLERFPLLQIGGDETGATRFRQIRSVIRTRTGRIVVADGATNQVRMFDLAGEHVRTIGGVPGGEEFERLAWVHEMAGDSLLAFDYQRPGGTILDADGNVSRAFRLVVMRDYFMAIPQGIFSNGTVVSMAGPPDVIRDTVVGGFRVDVHFPLSSAAETLAGVIGPLPQRWCPTRNCARIRSPFEARWAVRGDRFYYLRPDRSRVTVYDSAGRLTRELDVRSPGSGGPIAARQLLVSTTGDLWLRISDGDWLVVDDTGSPKWTVEIPSGMQVFDAGDGYVLGVLRDAQDREWVVMWGLKTNAREGPRDRHRDS